jgi:hypothetical protein
MHEGIERRRRDCAGPWRKSLAILAGALALSASILSSTANAQGTIEPRRAWGLEEVRLGAFAHSIDGALREGGVAVNGELVFSSFFPRYQNAIAYALLSAARPHLGATISTEGHTSQLYFGTTWTWPVAGPVFIEASFGGAVHDGLLKPDAEHHRGTDTFYGCTLNFRESASAGIDLGASWRFMLTIDHMSNAGLCRFNRGLTNAGGRLSYRLN